MSEQFWWYVTRASGMVAAVLIAFTLIWGLALSTKIVNRRGLPAWLTDLHRGLAALSVVFVGIHMFALWADSYEQFGLAELFVPFASTWKPTPVAWGVFAVWMLAVVQGTSLLQRRMPKKAWHRIHLLSFPIGVLVGIHAMTAGTDSGNLWFRIVTLVLACGVLFLTIFRVITRNDKVTTSRIPEMPSGSASGGAAGLR